MKRSGRHKEALCCLQRRMSVTRLLYWAPHLFAVDAVLLCSCACNVDRREGSEKDPRDWGPRSERKRDQEVPHVDMAMRGLSFKPNSYQRTSTKQDDC